MLGICAGDATPCCTGAIIAFVYCGMDMGGGCGVINGGVIVPARASGKFKPCVWLPLVNGVLYAGDKEVVVCGNVGEPAFSGGLPAAPGLAA